MKYGKQLLLRTRGADYEAGYIDYKQLKQLLKQCAPSVQPSTDNLGDAQQQQPPGDAAAIAAFRSAFIAELDRVNAFYRARESEVATIQAELAKELAPIGAPPTDDNRAAFPRLAQLAETLELMGDFVVLNQLGFTKILKKCEKKVPTLHVGEGLHDRIVNTHFVTSSARVDMLNWTRKELLKSAPQVRREPTPTPITTTVQQPDYPTYDHLDLDALPVGHVSRMWIAMAMDGLGQPIKVPVVVAKGERVGPVLGITACLHGNELNGIPLIHRLFRELDCAQLNGIVVAVPVANTPGYMQAKRGYLDNSDLNRVMPGKRDGTSAQHYAYNFVSRIVSKLNYLIDMHTASTGRVNSLYVRANMRNPIEARMALLQNPQIIVHNTGPDGSLRSAAVEYGIHAITVEVGDPQRFHKRFINFALLGVENIMCSLKMVFREPQHPDFEPVICTKSHWMFTRSGGVLTVLPEINSWVKEGEVIARIHSIFGDLIEEYFAPSDGIIVGKSVNPVCSSGDRILHLGVVTTQFAAGSLDGHEGAGKVGSGD